MNSDNKKPVFKIIQLDEHEKRQNISYIRNTEPDYLLVIRNFGLKLVSEDASTIAAPDVQALFQQTIDCCVFLNYGDLFLSTLNSLEDPDIIYNAVVYFASAASKTQAQINELIQQSIHDQKNHPFNDTIVRKLNADYKRYETALSFSTLISLATVNNNAANWMLKTSLTQLLTSGGLEYGPTSAAQFKKNLYESGYFSNISLTIHYPMSFDDSSFLDSEEYSFSSFTDLLAFDVRQIAKLNQDIKVCQHCNRFFIPANRKDEKYCDFAIQGFKRCKQVAFSYRVNSDEVLKSYRKIYKTQNARKQRNKHRPNIDIYFERWAAFAKQQLTACQNGEITIEEMEKTISGNEWMNNSSM